MNGLSLFNESHVASIELPAASQTGRVEHLQERGDYEDLNDIETESCSWRISAAVAETLHTQVCCLFSSIAFRLPGSRTAPQWPATWRADQYRIHWTSRRLASAASAKQAE